MEFHGDSGDINAARSTPAINIIPHTVPTYSPHIPRTPQRPPGLLVLQGEPREIRVDEHRDLDLQAGQGGATVNGDTRRATL